jgi:hypothetical protein
MIRCYASHADDAARPNQPATNSLNRARPRDGPRPGDLFHEPEAHPKSAATGAPPGSLYVTAARCRETSQEIQAAMRREGQ